MSEERPGGTLGPAAEDVRRRMLADIADGSLRPGERLGGERDLAERYGVSRSTLRAALDELESLGAVSRVRGRSGGTFVAERKVERDLTSLAGLPTYLRRQGFEAGARVLSTATLSADDEIAASLAIAPGDVVFEVVRTRLADGVAISLERARFPADRFPGLLDQPLGGSLYALLGTTYALVAREATEHIEVVGASANAARILGVRRGASLVSVERTTVDADGRPFEHSHDLFRADRVRLVVRALAEHGEPGLVATSVEIL